MRLLALRVDPGKIWHVGFRPDAWGWTDWRFAADDGRFNGRWDDPDGKYRTLYAGSSLYSCLVEILAKFRPHSQAIQALTSIDADSGDDATYPTVFGQLDRNFLRGRLGATAELAGAYCMVSDSRVVATLRPIFLNQALELGAADFDASTLKDSAPRNLTRSVSRWLYKLKLWDPRIEKNRVDGIEFLSRHGDDLRLWAIFERPNDDNTSPQLHSTDQFELTADIPELQAALELHQLRWA